ncbi:hypothetical protein MSPP1_003757 [Malassezia sp. CBS 17886]|nr:hypothetical protein MSPP1_003757 [Malassezia sp. CBS 17886]
METWPSPEGTAQGTANAREGGGSMVVDASSVPNSEPPSDGEDFQDASADERGGRDRGAANTEGDPSGSAEDAGDSGAKDTEGYQRGSAEDAGEGGDSGAEDPGQGGDRGAKDTERDQRGSAEDAGEGGDSGAEDPGQGGDRGAKDTERDQRGSAEDSREERSTVGAAGNGSERAKETERSHDTEDAGPPPNTVADGFDDDFGDFAEGTEADAQDAEPAAETLPDAVSAGAPPAVLSLASTDLGHLAEQMHRLLPRDFYDATVHARGVEEDVVKEGMRQVEGLSQVLVTNTSRTLFRELQTPVPLPAQPLDWTRSQTRRQLLIMLGVPVNLDEVLRADTWSRQAGLPPLELHLEPDAAPGTPPEHDEDDAPSGERERWGERRRRQLGLSRPELDTARVDAVAQITEDQLTLQTLPELHELVHELQTLNTQASDVLAYHLTVREAFASDAEMYHTMIRDLVAGATNKVASARKSEKKGIVARAAERVRSGSRPGTPG